MRSEPKAMKHVFVSYSRADTPIVQTLIDGLERRSVPVWLDKKSLEPGTPDWQKTIREAIDEAFAVIVVASPRSGQSIYVQAELALARSKGCPLFPVWVSGDQWIECIPLDMVNTQFIDYREASEEQIQIITNALKEVISRTYPNNWLANETANIPYNCTSIRLPDNDNKKTVMVNTGAYETLQAMLDDLYVIYLKDAFPPFSYGDKWIISVGIDDFGHVKEYVVCWESFVGKTRLPISRANSSWTHQPIESYGCVGRTCEIVTDIPKTAYGLAVHDKRLLDSSRRWVKNIFTFVHGGFLQKIPFAEAGSQDYLHRVIQFNTLVDSQYENETKMFAFLQTEKALSELNDSTKRHLGISDV